MTAIESQEQALLRAIILDPWDDGLRLIYADIIEEKGDDERAHRIRRMKHEIGGHLNNNSVTCMYRGGFIEEVYCPLWFFMANSHIIAENNPIRKWTLTDREPSPWMTLTDREPILTMLGYYWYLETYRTSGTTADVNNWPIYWIPKEIVREHRIETKFLRTLDEAHRWLQDRCYEYARRNLEPEKWSINQ